MNITLSVHKKLLNQCRKTISKLESRCEISIFNSNIFFGVLRLIYESIHTYSFTILFSVVILSMLYLAYKAYWNPENYKKDFTELGFDHIKGSDRAASIARAQSSRKLGAKLPPPYPNGWFAVAESRELKVGDVFGADVLGQNLCVYRGEDGVARCVDTYCPHLGANMAVGGAVSGNCIECPFHQWRFGSGGALVSVPGSDTVPKGVSIKSWTTVEADGAVWIWHDAEDRQPLWTLEDAPELKSWAFRGRNEFTVGCHIQEIPENGADVAHLNAVHSPSVLTDLGKRFPFLQNFIGSHHWTAEWTRGEGHRAIVKLTHDLKLMKANLLHLDVDITQIGPGQVHLRMNSAFGPLLIVLSVTPMGPLMQKVIHRVFSPPSNAIFAAILNRAESYMIERDIVIWNSKKYVSAPSYVRSDKSIRMFRSWFSQFYTDHSISFKDARTNALDW